MTPVIRIDDEVMNKLMEKAIGFGLVFGTPNEVLRTLLGLHKQDVVISDKYVDIEMKNPSKKQEYHFMPVPKRIRRFFPGYKLPFLLETDIGEIKTYVTSAPQGTHIGDPDKGAYIQSGLKKWFDIHKTQIIDGSILRIQVLEPRERYKLSIK